MLPTILSILLKLTPIILQLISVALPTQEEKHEGITREVQAEQEKLTKEGRPTWH